MPPAPEIARENMRKNQTLTASVVPPAPIAPRDPLPWPSFIHHPGAGLDVVENEPLRTAEEAASALRHADQVVFEGFDPGRA